ncbi:MAG TPA: hypothetical protein VGD48_14040 [Kutzneria sp.]
MPRRNRPHRSGPKGDDEPRPRTHGWARTESGPDGEWHVRPVGAADKTYRCPGCDHEIRPGTPHVVAWPADDYGSVEDRRHWHTGCWNSRGRRKPTTRRW